MQDKLSPDHFPPVWVRRRLRAMEKRAPINLVGFGVSLNMVRIIWVFLRTMGPFGLQIILQHLIISRVTNIILGTTRM